MSTIPKRGIKYIYIRPTLFVQNYLFLVRRKTHILLCIIADYQTWLLTFLSPCLGHQRIALLFALDAITRASTLTRFPRGRDFVGKYGKQSQQRILKLKI